MECMNCGKEFEAKRATAKYCSDKCRKLAFQDERVSVPENGKTLSVPEQLLPANYGEADCQCMHCQSKRANNSKNIINHTGKHIDGQVMRVTLPGDIDYDGGIVKGEDGEWRPKAKAKPEPMLILDLPACIPSVIAQRYARHEPAYVRTINRLLTHALTELEQQGVWMPVWREQMGE